MAGADFRDEVIQKLVTLFEDEPETLSQILFFLSRSDKENNIHNAADAALSTCWKNFKHLFYNDTAFKMYAKRLVDDTRATSQQTALAMASEDFRDEVIKKLAALYENEPETLTRILTFLADFDKANNLKSADDAELSTYWKNFKSLLYNKRAFKLYAQRLADDTKKQEKHPKFVRVMHDLHDNWMNPAISTPPASQYQFQLVHLRDTDLIPHRTRAKILAYVRDFTRDNEALVALTNTSLTLANTAGKVVKSGLAAISLPLDAINSILRWWRGELSGKRCAKSVVDATVTVAAGAGGGCGGALMGAAVAGPVGAVVGGIVGVVLSSGVASVLIDRLTLSVFDLPKSVALEKAYNYLGVKPNASNADVYNAYRKLCKKHHPDQGGDHDEFIVLQSYMGVIKAARGEL